MTRFSSSQSLRICGLVILNWHLFLLKVSHTKCSQISKGPITRSQIVFATLLLMRTFCLKSSLFEALWGSGHVEVMSISKQGCKCIIFFPCLVSSVKISVLTSSDEGFCRVDLWHSFEQCLLLQYVSYLTSNKKWGSVWFQRW